MEGWPGSALPLLPEPERTTLAPGLSVQQHELFTEAPSAIPIWDPSGSHLSVAISPSPTTGQ
eukprot:13765746-Alexandrium_andersonii.AAC.1